MSGCAPRHDQPPGVGLIIPKSATHVPALQPLDFLARCANFELHVRRGNISPDSLVRTMNMELISDFKDKINHRDTEDTERKQNPREEILAFLGFRFLSVSSVSLW